MSEKEFKKFDKTLSNILSSSAGAASPPAAGAGEDEPHAANDSAIAPVTNN